MRPGRNPRGKQGGRERRSGPLRLIPDSVGGTVPHSTFFRFMGPSLVAMFLFIALPIVSIFVQSLHIEHSQVVVLSETCQPFDGCTQSTSVDAAATAQLRAEQPLGQFDGFGIERPRATGALRSRSSDARHIATPEHRQHLRL